MTLIPGGSRLQLPQRWLHAPFLWVTVIAVLQGCAVIGDPQKPLDPDIDKDGVENNQDKCPETLTDAVVNQQGCDLFAGVLDGVKFVTNGSKLNDDAKEALNELAQGLKSHPETVVGVYAHTDNRGKATVNLELSKRRVLSVVEYLVKTGVSAQQLKPFGYGESRPIVSNATPEGRLKNRRIEIVLLQ